MAGQMFASFEIWAFPDSGFFFFRYSVFSFIYLKVGICNKLFRHDDRDDDDDDVLVEEMVMVMTMIIITEVNKSVGWMAKKLKQICLQAFSREKNKKK